MTEKEIKVGIERMRGIDALGRSLAESARTLGYDPLAKYAEVYQGWFPDRAFTIENFKQLPEEIIKMFGVECLCSLMGEYYQATDNIQSAKRRKEFKACCRNTIKKMVNGYHVDLIDIEEELKRRKYTEPEIEMLKRLFL